MAVARVPAPGPELKSQLHFLYRDRSRMRISAGLQNSKTNILWSSKPYSYSYTTLKRLHTAILEGGCVPACVRTVYKYVASPIEFGCRRWF